MAHRLEQHFHRLIPFAVFRGLISQTLNAVAIESGFGSRGLHPMHPPDRLDVAIAKHGGRQDTDAQQ